MGYFSFIYKQRYDYIFQQTIDAIEDESEQYLEIVRDNGFSQTLSQISEQIKGFSKNDLEATRVNSVHQLENIETEISAEWEKLAHKTTIAALTYNYISYTLFIIPIVLLLLNQILASQICSLVVVAIVFFINIDPVRNTISYYIYGVNKVSDDLGDLYLLYGVVEATITAADYRNISKPKRDRWVYSNHHQKAPN